MPRLACPAAGRAGGAPPPRSCAPRPPPTAPAAAWRCGPAGPAGGAREARCGRRMQLIRGRGQQAEQLPRARPCHPPLCRASSTRSWNSQEVRPCSALALCQLQASSGLRSSACGSVKTAAALDGSGSTSVGFSADRCVSSPDELPVQRAHRALQGGCRSEVAPKTQHQERPPRHGGCPLISW